MSFPLIFLVLLFFPYRVLAETQSLKILHCSLFEELDKAICLRCEEGYFLDQQATSCVQPYLPGSFENCIQISDFNECMRCNCEYALQLENNRCVKASILSLVGCEVFKESGICIRPKPEYLLFQEEENTQSSSIRFGSGLHCEIFSVFYDHCLQCHSGFQLDKSMNCQQIAEGKLFNEFFSYFSSDGELQSRSNYFIPTKHGVQPQISNCEAYAKQQKEQEAEQKDNSFTLRCSKCSAGRSLTRSQTQCVKQPIALCRIVSDSNHSICEECFENDKFYLSRVQQEQSQQQLCLPRQETNLDPTTRCLLFSQTSPICRKCMNGLEATPLFGCDIPRSSNHQQEYQSDSFQEQFYHLFNNDIKCIFWLVSGVCGQCAQGLTITDKGQCLKHFDSACQISNSKGGCLKCMPLYYYFSHARKCVEISHQKGCLGSFGFEDKCDLCFPLHFFDKQGFCQSQTIRNCSKIVENRTNKCEICESYYYYESSSNECVPIKNHLYCLFSDGIVDACQQCQRNYMLSDYGECVPSSIQLFDGQFCYDKYHYFNETINSCLEYTFLSDLTECFQFDRQDNKCVRCNYGFYVDFRGMCVRVQSCELSDGISDFCYFSNSQTTFINEFGQVEPMSKDCDSNRIENICTTCYQNEVKNRENNQNLTNPQNNSDCIPFNGLIYRIVNNCEQIAKVDDSREFVCQVCQILFFPDDETGVCKSIQDFGCLVSSGRSRNCTLCKQLYKLNPSTKTCEIERYTIIPFCEMFNEQHNICVKCKSLFFIEDQQCRAIFDPDCEFSEGIYNSCLKCNNGIILNKQLAIKVNFQVYCSQLSMIINKDSPDQIVIHQLHHPHHLLQLIPNLWKISIEFCIRYSTIDFSCLECKEGFYINNYQDREVICSLINILNCIKLKVAEWPFQICIQCAEGYFLSINGECVQIKNCLKFNGVCVECSKESFLMYGVCHEMSYCKEQNGQQCKKCVSGYALKDNEYVEESWVIFPQKCMKIPHCKESNGISSSCKSCDNGFEGNKEICMRNRDVSIADCEEQDDKNQCIRCRSLFVLQKKDENNQCIRANGLMNCSHSNGIDDYCISCSVLGYKLDENNQCKRIELCEISNGVDWCVVCENRHIVNLQGECQEIDRKVENCIVYSFEKLTIRNWFQYDSAISNEEINNINNSQMIETTQPGDNLLDASNSTLSLNITPSYGCIRCLSYFSVDKTSDFQQCLPLSLISQENCAFSNGVLDNCAMCSQGFQERQSHMSNYNHTCQLRKSKILTPHNIGCEIFDFRNHCIKCFDGFFFGQGDFCFPRQNRHRKCKVFNMVKDECQVCQSGYTLKRINQQIGDDNADLKSVNNSHLICFKLQPEETVQNCAKYQPNTNKCIECVKRFSELPDLVEYVLNEKDNVCEDVLHLMCRGKIIGNSCQGEYYIPHCVDYDKSHGKRCLVCQNGYFLREERSECKQHNQIQNCQVYSQDIENVCKICEVLFYLAEGSTVCRKISHGNCQVGEKYSDRCAICINKSAVDMNTGECIISPIQNCIVLKQQDGPQSQWICQQCRKRYFQLSENKLECIFRMVDANCKITDKNNVCLECKDGYLLNIHQDCLRIHSLCQIKHCLRYFNNSSSEDMSCEQCQIPFLIEQNDKVCKVAGVDNIKDIQQEQEPDKLNKINQDSGLFESDFSLIVEILGFVIIIVIIAIILVKIFLQNQTKLRVSKNLDNYPERSYTGETNVEIQICQPIQRGQESHDITISSLDVSEDITLHEN